MMTRAFQVVLLGGGLCLLLGFAAASQTPVDRDSLQKLYDEGNYKEAYEGYRNRALDAASAPETVGEDLRMAVLCLQRLGRMPESDQVIERAVAVHAGNWRFLWETGKLYLNLRHYGYVIAGEFQRGNRRGGGEYVNSFARDRTQGLQLFVQAMGVIPDGAESELAAKFYYEFGSSFQRQQGSRETWRLQALTDLDVLPDLEPGWYYGGSDTGAPVTPDGKPVTYGVPETFAGAKNDGERWRWAHEQSAVVGDRIFHRNMVKLALARFYQEEFGVQTLARFGFPHSESEDESSKDDPFTVHTLTDKETLARLASGVRRFALPEGFNYIVLFREIAATDDDTHAEQALIHLAHLYENRRQYPRAAATLRKSIERFGAQRGTAGNRLQQIVGHWGRFDPVMQQAAGRGAQLDFRFRNGKRVDLEAHEIRIDKLLEDVRAYVRSNPERLDWNRVNLGNIGYRLVNQQQTAYVGRRVAQWSMDLEPRKEHRDRRVTISTPLQNAGAYLLTARMEDGNTSKAVLWINDTVIIQKRTSNGRYLYVGDAVTGAPVADAEVQFFDYRQQRVDRSSKYDTHVKEETVRTDAAGQVLRSIDADRRRFRSLITASTRSGRFAYLGFTGLWTSAYNHAHNPQKRIFGISDRPVYRPDQMVRFKAWVNTARYDVDQPSEFAGQQVELRIVDPRNQEIYKKALICDEFGGVEGELGLAKDAILGNYNIQLDQHGAIGFRVEEYKKPEFEVSVAAPVEPITLGDKIEATVTAKYYYGSPVTEATVRYKVLRTAVTQSWFPSGRWDWLYGSGYWWYGQSYQWYPGWGDWGCLRPPPWWWQGRAAPPEVVAEQEVAIGADGTLKIEIDTALAKALHGDQDHQYRITAEVVDQSRRTIVGAGTVMAARKPFKVFVWPDRGYYRTGQAVDARVSARTADGKPVAGSGKMELFSVTYPTGKPTEKLINSWDLTCGEDGDAGQRLEASQPGQYRLACRVTNENGHTETGAYVFTVIGAGAGPDDFRYNALELVNDKAEYRPGDTAELLVNTARRDSTVLLFLRPVSGTYLPAEVIRIDGKSTIANVGITRGDMPNIFVEAVTISDGEIHTQVTSLVVPPEKRELSVEVVPSSKEYLPGEQATIDVKVTDHNGEPYVGSTVVSIYDRSVEYISGGSNVAAILPFFWSWKRYHNPGAESNLTGPGVNLVPNGQERMNDIGVFGGLVAPEESELMLGSDEFGSGSKKSKSRSRSAPAAEASGIAGGALSDDAAPFDMDAEEEDGADWGEEGALVDPTVRENFADTALWVGSLTTGVDGKAQVSLDMPENLTSWKVRVWSLGHGTRVGEGTTEVVTRKNLILRMQAPRFFTEKDEVVLSANVHNYLENAKKVRVDLELDGRELSIIDTATQWVEVEAGGEARVDWRVGVQSEGEAIVRMVARTDEESDAMQMTFPVFVHGMLKMDAVAGSLRPADGFARIGFRVPEERRPEATRLELRYSPSLASAMVDALPYLADYPYGCTEQTLNRFVPTVVTQKVLLDMDLDLEAIRDKRTNLNAQELGDPKERARGWKRFQRNPVFDAETVQAMVTDGIKVLGQMQLSDGGWGWFSGYGERSYPHTTATVVHGLQVAQSNDVKVPEQMLARGIAWLKGYQERQIQLLRNAPTRTRPFKLYASNLDAFVYMVLLDADVHDRAMQDYLYRDRTRLSVYSLAMYGLALHKQGEKDALAMVLRNISQFLVQDDENDTAYLKLPEGGWWYWHGNEIEADAYYLKLLARTDPKGTVAPRLVKYLLNNRKHATYWSSTRDTALCIEALAEYIEASGEGKPDMTVEVWYRGEKQKEVAIDGSNLFSFDSSYVVTGDAVPAGSQQIELRKRGSGPLYYNLYVTNFSLEDSIPRAGLELKVHRKLYKLVPEDKEGLAQGDQGQVVKQKEEKYRRVELGDLSVLESGDLVEVELEIESKNDYEYLIIEDMKAAGFEPVDLRSGYTGNSLGAYRELRDRSVSFFLRQLPRGQHSMSYRLRAEIPGRFSALPAVGYAMYAPELKGNSDEIKLVIED